MKKFESERTHKEVLFTKRFNKGIPLTYFTPLKEDNKSIVFVFSSGLGGTNQFFQLLNYPIFDNNYLVAYERMGEANNKNKPTRLPITYINELKEVVLWALRQWPNKKIFLLGESWGSALTISLYYKHPELINGAIFWNMPFNIKDPSKKPWSKRFKLFPKMLGVVLFGIPSFDYDAKDPSDFLSSNILLRRMSKLATANKPTNNKVTVASWWTFKPAWRKMFRMIKKNKGNFIYVQSAEDFFINNEKIKQIKKIDVNKKYFRFLSKGYHILFNEDQVNNELFKIMDEVIKR